MKRKLWFPVLVLLLAALTLIGASALDFQDVPPSHWGHSAVNWAYEEGLMSGLSDTVFDPDGNMTRSMFVSVLYRLTVKRGGDVTTTRETAFPDIPADSTAWYAESAFWAAENGIVAGLADGSFGVNVPISREQMAAIVCRYIENYLDFSLKTYEGEITFHDSAAISPWALDPVAKFQNMGIVVGDGSGNYRPTANTTRAAVAVIFRNLSDFLTRVVDSHVHTFEEVSRQDATCTVPGSVVSVCTVCEQQKTELLPVLGHTVVIDDAVPATCTETGLTEGSHCSVCGEVLVAQTVVPMLPHTVVTDGAVAATCTETGLTEGSHCSVCNTVLVAQTVVEKLPHTVVTDDAVAATCTETGLSEGSHCSVCNTVLVAQTVVPVLPHTVVTDDAVAATCTETGLTEGSHCSVCGEVLVPQETVAALGHFFGAWFAVSENEERRDCVRCDVFETRTRIDLYPVLPPVYVMSNATFLLRDAVPQAQTETVLRGKAGRNEGEGMQFVLRFPDAVSGVWIETSPLTDGQGHTLETVESYRQHYMEHTSTSYHDDAGDMGALPHGWYPDALVPLYDDTDGGYDNRQSDIPSGQNQGYWITVWTALDQTPATYTGTVTVHYNEGEDLVIPIVFEVWDIEVPKSPSVITAYNLWKPDDFYKKSGVGSSIMSSVQILQMYYDFLLKYRISSTEIPTEVFVGRNDLVEEWYQSIRGTLMRDEVSGMRLRYMGSNAQPDPADIQLRDWMAEDGVLDKIYFADYDEPASMTPAIQNDLEVKQSYNPTVPNIVITGRQDFIGVTNGWCPSWGGEAGPDFEAFTRTRQALGETVWFMGCCVPCYPYASYMVVDTLMSPRMVHWIQKDLGVTGEIYWATTMWYVGEYQSDGIRDVWTSMYGTINKVNNMGENPGDGTLVYPAWKGFLKKQVDGYVNRNVPVPTLRLEALRDGYEDLEYFYLMEAKLNAILANLGMTDSYTADELLNTYYNALYRQGVGIELTSNYDHFNSQLLEDIRCMLAEDLMRENDSVFVAVSYLTETTKTVTVLSKTNETVLINGIPVNGTAFGDGYRYETVYTNEDGGIVTIDIQVGQEHFNRILNYNLVD